MVLVLLVYLLQAVILFPYLLKHLYLLIIVLVSSNLLDLYFVFFYNGLITPQSLLLAAHLMFELGVFFPQSLQVLHRQLQVSFFLVGLLEDHFDIFLLVPSLQSKVL